MLFMQFDGTMMSILAFDLLSKNACHASNFWVHFACSTVMVFAVMMSCIVRKVVIGLSCTQHNFVLERGEKRHVQMYKT